MVFVGLAAGSGRRASARQCNNDFESILLPAYQHVRPSMIRKAQCPCRSFGNSRWHSNACAVEKEANMNAPVISNRFNVTLP
jgi:hypothetical protein